MSNNSGLTSHQAPALRSIFLAIILVLALSVFIVPKQNSASASSYGVPHADNLTTIIYNPSESSKFNSSYFLSPIKNFLFKNISVDAQLSRKSSSSSPTIFGTGRLSTGVWVVILGLFFGILLLIFHSYRLSLKGIEIKNTFKGINALIDEAPDTVIYVDEDGIIVRANNRIKALFGYEPDEVVGKQIEFLVPREHRANHHKYREKYVSGPQPRSMGEARSLFALTKDGREVPVAISLNSIKMENKTLSIAAVRDMSLEREYTTVLQEARIEAEKVSALKSAFLANMSHEIRTPLTGILGIGDLLRQSELTDEQRGHVDTMKDCGNFLLGIINDILDLSKLESDNFILSEDVLDIEELGKSLKSLYGNLAQDNQVKLSVDFTGSCQGKNLTGDPVRIRQILLNLTGNAVKFTPKGSVEVILNVADSDYSNSAILTMSVKDTGIGIPIDEQERIFNPFIQVERRRSHSSSGTGLGLSICKRLVNAMGGDIMVESKLGEGALFRATIPVKAANVITELNENKVIRPTHDHGNLSILVVDDNDLTRKLVMKMLEAKGVKMLDCAADGEEALAKILAKNYHAVLMDIRMPKLDGAEVIQRLKAVAPHKVHNIIAFTANVMADQIKEYEDLGFSATVSKPIDWHELMTAVGME